jgi:S1-C subfamily serine protease
LQYPRYFVVSDVSPEGTSLRPVFVGALSRVTSVRWSESVWAAPAGSNLGAGAFVFTTDGMLAGLAVEHEGHPAILPAEALMRAAERLLRDGSRGGGWLGLQVQGLTPAVASITASTGGVVVTWVDPEGPAAGSLRATDVIETIGGQALSTPDDWDAHVSLLTPGDPLLLGVRRAGEVQEIKLTAGEHPATPVPLKPDELGLTMRAVPRAGVEVVRVDPGSAAARAGIMAGDVITLIGETEGPTPADVTRVFAASPPSSALLVRVVRGDLHHVLALEKR